FLGALLRAAGGTADRLRLNRTQRLVDRCRFDRLGVACGLLAQQNALNHVLAGPFAKLHLRFDRVHVPRHLFVAWAKRSRFRSYDRVFYQFPINRERHYPRERPAVFFFIAGIPAVQESPSAFSSVQALSAASVLGYLARTARNSLAPSVRLSILTSV